MGVQLRVGVVYSWEWKERGVMFTNADKRLVTVHVIWAC